MHRVKSVLSSIQFSRSVVSNSLQPHGVQHARLPAGGWGGAEGLFSQDSSFVLGLVSCLENSMDRGAW